MSDESLELIEKTLRFLVPLRLGGSKGLGVDGCAEEDVR